MRGTPIPPHGDPSHGHIGAPSVCNCKHLGHTCYVSKLDVGSLGDYIREQRHAAQLSLRQLASTAGVSNPYLSQVERGLRKPSAEILTQIAAALRISAETLYVRAGLLEAQDNSRVRAAIARDSSLTERQRHALLEIYSAFLGENAVDSDPVAAGEPVVASEPPDLSVTGQPAAAAEHHPAAE